jgi:hypothetical protein
MQVAERRRAEWLNIGPGRALTEQRDRDVATVQEAATRGMAAVRTDLEARMPLLDAEITRAGQDIVKAQAALDTANETHRLAVAKRDAAHTAASRSEQQIRLRLTTDLETLEHAHQRSVEDAWRAARGTAWWAGMPAEANP